MPARLDGFGTSSATGYDVQVVDAASHPVANLQAEHLKPALAVVEQKVSPPCTRTVKEIRSMVEHFKAVPDFRERFESYPLWSMLTILLLATL